MKEGNGVWTSFLCLKQIRQPCNEFVDQYKFKIL